MTTVGHLQDLNAGVIARMLPALGLGTITIDVDGVVVSTGLQVERAFRGFNPHHRKVPSYYPILAHVAETTHILRVKNRSGNVHDDKASCVAGGGCVAGGCRIRGCSVNRRSVGERAFIVLIVAARPCDSAPGCSRAMWGGGFAARSDLCRRCFGSEGGTT
jgi:hypothetical protein